MILFDGMPRADDKMDMILLCIMMLFSVSVFAEGTESEIPEEKIITVDEATKKLVIDHVYDLAKISHSPLEAEQMSKFIARSNELLAKLF